MVNIPKSELYSVIQEFNPWWNGQPIGDLPDWERTAFSDLWLWAERDDSRRALLLTGARQVGKTTLLRQLVRRLISSGQPARSILYVTFDHPILKLAGLKATLEAWEELYSMNPGERRFLFLDEVQYVEDWQTWLKHQVDFHPQSKIAVTGSATPLRHASVESGVGRWETLPLSTLSFYEFLKLRKVVFPDIPRLASLTELFRWTPTDFASVREQARPLSALFHDYLLRGGFPEPAMVEDLSRCQRLLREDVVDKVIKRDMTALYGVRNIRDIERLFLYLCYHDGGMLDVATISRELDGATRHTVNNFLDLFESTHLIYRLKRYGVGKTVLKSKDKVYLADPAIPGAVLLLGRKLLEQPERLGAAVEACFFKHAYTRFYSSSTAFYYWRDKSKSEIEVDLIGQVSGTLVPFEVKYVDTQIRDRDLRGLYSFLEQAKVNRGYVISRRFEDFGPRESQPLASQAGPEPKVMQIPAALACLWMSTLSA